MSDYSSDAEESVLGDAGTGQEKPGVFSIVVFVDNSIQIVPTNWLRGEFCAYPPYKSDSEINKACKTKEIPEKSWNCYRLLKTLGSYNTYDEGRLKLKKAEDTSNLETDDPELEKRRRREKARKTFDDYVVDKANEPPYKRQKKDSKKYTRTVDATLPEIPPSMMPKVIPSAKSNKTQSSSKDDDFEENTELEEVDLQSETSVGSIAQASSPVGSSNAYENGAHENDLTSLPLDGFGDTQLISGTNGITVLEPSSVTKENPEEVRRTSSPPSIEPANIEIDTAGADFSCMKEMNQNDDSTESTGSENKTDNVSHSESYKSYKICPTCGRGDDVQGVDPEKLFRLKQMVDLFCETVDLVVDKDERNHATSSYEVLTPLLPLRNMEKISSFEKKLKQDSVFKSQLEDYFQRIGGKNHSQMTTRILKTTFTDEVVHQNFTFAGAKEKKAFKDLRIYAIIMNAVIKTFKDSSAQAIEAVVTNWVKNANTRIKFNQPDD